jgi:hypothetical protein
MKEKLSSDFSIIEFFPIMFKKRKRIGIFSIIGALLFFLSSHYFFSDTYYTEVRIVGEFSQPVQTKFGDYTFSSNNLLDYTHNIMDDRILDMTLNDLDSIVESKSIKVKFESLESKDNTSAILIAYSDIDGLPIENFLNTYFKNFLKYLNMSSYQAFLEEVLVDNSIKVDKLNDMILNSSKELEAYSVISDSVKKMYNDLKGFDKESFFSSETLEGINILTSHSAVLDKELKLSLLKIELEHTQRISKEISKELSKINSQTNVFDFIPLFNKRIRLSSTPSTAESRSTSKLIIAFIGAFIGFLIAMISLLAAEFIKR